MSQEYISTVSLTILFVNMKVLAASMKVIHGILETKPD